MPYLKEIYGQVFEVNNKVGMDLIEVFEERFKGDDYYLLCKIKDIKDRNILNCILYWHNLDPISKKMFAEKLSISPEKLQVTCDNLRDMRL